MPKEMPDNALEALGRGVDITGYVVTDYAGDQITCWSNTGILIFFNSAPIIWPSKRQSTIESSTFGSEFIALKTALEILMVLQYKLRMMGVPINRPAYIFGDNMILVNVVYIPQCNFFKKHLGVCYHAVQETSADGIWSVGFVKGKYNIAYFLTKIISVTTK